jgi:hypothetical protein
MSWHRLGFTTPAATTGAPLAAFRAVSRTSRVLEVGVFCNAATASQVALYRNTAAGYTATTSVVGQTPNPLWAAATSAIDTAWSTAPTVTAANIFSRAQMPAAIGSGFVWQFYAEGGIWVRTATATDHLVLLNSGGTTDSVLNGYMVWEE